MRRFLIHCNSKEPKAADAVQWITTFCHQNDCDLYLSPGVPAFDFIDDMQIQRYRDQEIDAVISVGGDGTFLASLEYSHIKKLPTLGINAGRLGFLASVPLENINDAMQLVLEGKYTVNQRIMLKCEIEGLDLRHSYALNDFTVIKRDSSSMIGIDCYLNGQYVTRYWADGLIVSTPTGSTGYNLSCGGPIIEPGAGVFIITPISPHNLNLRPLIVNESTTIELRVVSRNEHVMVTLDSRNYVATSDIAITISRNSHHAHLLNFDFNSYLDTLKSKLNWGIDARN